MAKYNVMASSHDRVSASFVTQVGIGRSENQFTYTFQNFFHPFVGELIAKLNKESLPGMLDATWQDGLKWDSLIPKPPPSLKFDQVWKDSLTSEHLSNYFRELYQPIEGLLVDVEYSPKDIDVSPCGPYANYNWELFFHIPLTVAVHLSKTQHFPEAQRWFHYIFDPTSTDPSVDPPMRFWKFLAFRNPDDAMTIDEVVRILSTPATELSGADECKQHGILQGYYAILKYPFQPHRVARTRHLAYQYCVVMKYLDNLIAWGDNLFQQDTVEAINEATQLYVLAANILGERPQRIPPLEKVKAKTFAQLRQAGLGPIGDTFVEAEGQFPLNLSPLNSTANGIDGVEGSPLFGIGRTLYFCIPANDKLLGYWDTVADRLFKIRHCMNIEGVVRPLALFDPPIDPGMLVKAAAAGIDIGSIVSGLNQPVGPVRSLFLIQKALELCGEVRNLGNSLLSALEKGDAEHLALVRQRHEIQIQQMSQEVRFLQWKSAQEMTTSLLTSRATALERFLYYKRLLNTPDDANAPKTLSVDHSGKSDDLPKLTEENFDEAYATFVSQYDKTLTHYDPPKYMPVGGDSPVQQSGAAGQGPLYLDANEDAELSIHSPKAQDSRDWASRSDMTASTLASIPGFSIKMHFWGLGGATDIPLGTILSNAARAVSSHFSNDALSQDRAGQNASKTGSYQRRADDWLLQYNLAAHELMQIGRQILTSLIAEQIAQHEYVNIKQQIANAQEVDQFLHEKFTNEDLYLWMQGEISRLYYEYYRFAFDTARKAEKTMKQELMRPELDAQDFVKFNYWDGGRKGLLSGEALFLDMKRMEMAYNENNKRELELIKHVSLRQLNPLALLALKATGTCQVTIPEWLYDLDGPHYMRRIKSVALSIPSVAGPYTGVNCTLSLLKSSIRKSPIAGGDYARLGSEDDRFVDYISAVQSIVTSGATNDSGMFETNLRDDRFLPFEGAGAISTWKLDLPDPKQYPAFDYMTISDVILHIRYTARQGVEAGKVTKALQDLFEETTQAPLALLFSLRHDFPNEWSKFVNAKDGSPFSATIRKDYFPYFAQSKAITVDGLDVYDGRNVSRHASVGDPGQATSGLGSPRAQYVLPAGEDQAKALTRSANAEPFLIIRYSLS